MQEGKETRKIKCNPIKPQMSKDDKEIANQQKGASSPKTSASLSGADSSKIQSKESDVSFASKETLSTSARHAKTSN